MKVSKPQKKSSKSKRTEVTLELDPGLVERLMECTERDSQASIQDAALVVLKYGITTLQAQIIEGRREKLHVGPQGGLTELPSTHEGVPLEHPIYSKGETGRGPFLVETMPNPSDKS